MRRSRFASPHAWLGCALLALPNISLAGPQLAWHLAAGVEHDSNVFDLPSNGNGNGNGGRGNPTPPDTIEKTLLGLDADYLWSRQKATFNAEFRDFQYQSFNELSHREYLLAGALNWVATTRVDGDLSLRREHSIVPFVESVGTALYLQTEQSERVSVNVRLTPRWRLENALSDLRLDSPRAGFPDLSQHETAVREGLLYQGTAHLRYGITADYLHGEFAHAGDSQLLHYSQTTAQFAGNYTLLGRPALDGAVGYTRRNEFSGGVVSAASWLVGYNRDLTGKTSVRLSLSRMINSYVSTASSEIDTGVSLGVSWRPTAKISLALGYVWTKSNFPDFQMLGGVAAAAAERRDRYQQVALDVKYAALRWLSVSPYLRYQTRSSSLSAYGFAGNIAGVDLRIDLR